MILPKTVSISATKIYDGSGDLLGYVTLKLELHFGNIELHTTATVNSKDVADSNKFIDSITLADATDGSGGLVSNYQLPSLDSVNAPVVIDAKTVGLSASRIYDGSEDLIDSDVTITTGVGSETLTHTGTTSNSKDVAVSNKYINAITLMDAVDGSGGLARIISCPVWTRLMPLL